MPVERRCGICAHCHLVSITGYGDEHNLVPEGDDRPALPFLANSGHPSGVMTVHMTMRTLGIRVISLPGEIMTASLLITPDCLATAWMPHQRRTVSVRLPCSATTKPTILGCSEPIRSPSSPRTGSTTM
jgi:hypothetical protein